MKYVIIIIFQLAIQPLSFLIMSIAPVIQLLKLPQRDTSEEFFPMPCKLLGDSPDYSDRLPQEIIFKYSNLFVESHFF
jgi:hypothetical protein